MLARSRRGMSPLIATVLLMAFAVALGGMIMKWSGDIGSQATLDCTAVKLDLIQFCFDGQNIRLHVRNTGEEIVSALTLGISEPSINILIQDSELRKGASLTKQIPFPVGDNVEVSLIPSLAVDGLVNACPAPYTTQKPLPKC